jgi:hypothetical protein
MTIIQIGLLESLRTSFGKYEIKNDKVNKTE